MRSKELKVDPKQLLDGLNDHIEWIGLFLIFACCALVMIVSKETKQTVIYGVFTIIYGVLLTLSLQLW